MFSVSAFLPGAASLPCLQKGEVWHTRDGAWTPSDFCMCHLGAAQRWGCSRPKGGDYLGTAKVAHPSDWGGKTLNGTIIILPDRYIHTDGCEKRMQLWVVEATRDKRIKNSAWMNTGLPQSQHEHFHKGKFLYALPLSLNTEGQRTKAPAGSVSTAATGEQGRP